MPPTLGETADPTIVGATDILTLAVLLILGVVGAASVYRAMQRPRIVLTEVEPGTWRARRRDVVLYLVSIPFLVTAWDLFLILVLVIGANTLSARQIMVVASAVIVAVRVLAHVTRELSHELAKSIPLTLVTLVLINGQLRSSDSVASVFGDFARTVESGPAGWLLPLGDVVITTCWYWLGVRWLAARGRTVPGTAGAR